MQNFSCQTILTNSAIFVCNLNCLKKYQNLIELSEYFKNPHELSDNGKLGGNMESKISPKGNIGIKKMWGGNILTLLCQCVIIQTKERRIK